MATSYRIQITMITRVYRHLALTTIIQIVEVLEAHSRRSSTFLDHLMPHRSNLMLIITRIRNRKILTKTRTMMDQS